MLGSFLRGRSLVHFNRIPHGRAAFAESPPRIETAFIRCGDHLYKPITRDSVTTSAKFLGSKDQRRTISPDPCPVIVCGRELVVLDPVRYYLPEKRGPRVNLVGEGVYAGRLDCPPHVPISPWRPYMQAFVY